MIEIMCGVVDPFGQFRSCAKNMKKKIHEICKKLNLCAVSHALSNTCQRPSLFHFIFLLLLLQNYGEIYDQ